MPVSQVFGYLKHTEMDICLILFLNMSKNWCQHCHDHTFSNGKGKCSICENDC